jgi:hypothetical protein
MYMYFFLKKFPKEKRIATCVAAGATTPRTFYHGGGGGGGGSVHQKSQILHCYLNCFIVFVKK